MTTLPKTVCLTWRAISAGEELLHYGCSVENNYFLPKRIETYRNVLKRPRTSSNVQKRTETHRNALDPTGRCSVLYRAFGSVVCFGAFRSALLDIHVVGFGTDI